MRAQYLHRYSYFFKQTSSAIKLNQIRYIILIFSIFIFLRRGDRLCQLIVRSQLNLPFFSFFFENLKEPLEALRKAES